MAHIFKIKMFLLCITISTQVFAKTDLSLREKQLLNSVYTNYKGNMQLIETFEAKYRMERVDGTHLENISNADLDSSKKTVKIGELGFEGNKLYNIESLDNDNKSSYFVQRGDYTRMRPSGVNNYVAQSGTAGRLKQFTPAPWDVFDSGFTSDLIDNKIYEILSVEEVSNNGEDYIKIVGTKKVLVEENKWADMRADVYYLSDKNYAPSHLESYLSGTLCGKNKVKEYDQIEIEGNIIYVPLAIEGHLQKPDGTIFVSRNYYIDKESIRINKGISDEKFEIKINAEDTLYDLDIATTLSAPDHSMLLIDKVILDEIDAIEELSPEKTSSDISHEILKNMNVDLCGGLQIELVYLLPSDFLMGSSDTEISYGLAPRNGFKKSRPKNEGFLHKVKMGNGFYIGKYEITNAQYRCFKPDYHQPRYKKQIMDNDNQPAMLNWFEAKQFCDWLNKKTGLKVHLPNEAEWEYACRAGSDSRFFWGNDANMACKYANILDEKALTLWPDHVKMYNKGLFKCQDGFLVAAPVGSFFPNAFGLYDMLGNADEWCEDVYIDSDSKKISPDILKNSETIFRVVRGGSYSSSINKACSAARRGVLPDMGQHGFRIVIGK